MAWDSLRSQPKLDQRQSCARFTSLARSGLDCTYRSNVNRYGTQDLIEQLLRIYPQELEGDVQLARMSIPGDFVVRADADFEQYRLALQTILSEAAGDPVTLTLRNVDQPAIAFEGTWQAKPPLRGPPIIDIYGAYRDDLYTGGGGGTGGLSEFGGWVGRWIKKSVIVEAAAAPAKLSWRYHRPRRGGLEIQQQAHDPALVCSHIQEQTGLSWKEEVRSVRRLFVERGG